MRSRTTAGVLALLLGGLGVHKFYLGKGGQGLLYLFFCWTFIPAVIAFVEAIMLFSMNDAEFNARYNAGMVGAGSQPQNIVVNVASTAVAGRGDRIAKLKELHELKSAGVLTDTEYESEKRKLLASTE